MGVEAGRGERTILTVTVKPMWLYIVRYYRRIEEIAMSIKSIPKSMSIYMVSLSL